MNNIDCPLSIKSITPTSLTPQPYDEPMNFDFLVHCDEDMKDGFEVHFFYMNLDDASKDIPLGDPYDIDALPEGPTEFELPLEMCPVDKIPFDELIGSHGVEIKFKYQGQWVARRACKIVISYKDEKQMEENMPDEILAEHLLVRTVGIHGPKTVTKASSADKEVTKVQQQEQQQNHQQQQQQQGKENSSNIVEQEKENATTHQTAPAEKCSGQIRQRDEEESKSTENNVPPPAKSES